MDVMKAIRWVFDAKQDLLIGRTYNLDRVNKADGVINLLEEGDKYKKIVEEVERFLEPGVITEIPEDMVGSRHIDIITYQIKKIKQKYFPKKFKRKFVIELETEDVHAIRNADSHIRSRFSDPHFFGCEVKMREDRG